MKIEGKTFIVTGGASGLGEATARELVKRGANVSIFDWNDEGAEKVASSLGEQGFAPGKVDVSSQQDVKAALQKTVEKYGRLAGVVNCGGVLSVGMTAMPEGVTGEGGIGTIQYEDFERIIRVNLLGTFNVTQQVAQIILGQEAYEGEEEKGVVVNTSSIAFQDGPPGLVAYSASKGGVASMTLPLARDLGYFGIRVMAIAPGSFHTNMTVVGKEVTQADAERMLSGQAFPNRRIGQPAEYANLVCSIFENTYLNGEVIRLDAGARLNKV